jgi:hypothetical protein
MGTAVWRVKMFVGNYEESVVIKKYAFCVRIQGVCGGKVGVSRFFSSDCQNFGKNDNSRQDRLDPIGRSDRNTPQYREST